MRDSSQTAGNRFTIFTGRGESASSTPGLFASTSQSGRNRLRRVPRFPRHGLAAMAIGGLVVLSACTASPPGTGATTPPGSTNSATAATSPAPTTAAPTTAAAYKPATAKGPAQNVPVPVVPEKAKEFSKAGLIAFAEYWYQTLGYSFETGDPDPMEAISDPGCRTCEAIGKMVVAGHSDGKWIMGGRMVIGTPSTSFASAPDGTYQAITMARQEQVKYFKADKSLSKDLGVTIAEADILVGVYKDGRWVALTVEHLDGSNGS